MFNYNPHIAVFNTIKKDDKMMSRFGMFFKPVLETTVYSTGAAAIGHAVYHAGTYIQNKTQKQEQEKEQSERFVNDMNLPPETDDGLPMPMLKLSF